MSQSAKGEPGSQSGGRRRVRVERPGVKAQAHNLGLPTRDAEECSHASAKRSSHAEEARTCGGPPVGRRVLRRRRDEQAGPGWRGRFRLGLAHDRKRVVHRHPPCCFGPPVPPIAKKADVGEHFEMFPQSAYSLTNLPAGPGCPSASHPTTSPPDCTLRVGECKGLPAPNRTRKTAPVLQVRRGGRPYNGQGAPSKGPSDDHELHAFKRSGEGGSAAR